METERPQSYYAIIPAPVRYDKGLDPAAKLLYAEITALCNSEGHCWASNEYFAELEGISVRTVQRMIAKLEARGYICCEMAATPSGSERRIYAGLLPAPGGGDKSVMTPQGGGDNSVTGGGDKSVTPPIEVEEFNVNNIPPIVPQPTDGFKKLSQPKWHPEWFNPLYDFYPNHKSRQAACRAWDKLKPDREFCAGMYDAIALQKKSAEWKKDGGAYIPHFATWLNGRKWEDEVRPAPADEDFGSWAPDPEMAG